MTEGEVLAKRVSALPSLATVAEVSAIMLSGIAAVGEEDQLRVCAFEQQDSALLSIFAATNALIRLPMGVPAQPPGTLVDVLPLDGA